MFIKLYNFLDKSAFLKFSYCSFLNWWLSTSTAKITESWATSPTEQNPFLTASVAYSTWKRWPLGEKTVIAESYIQNYFKFRFEDVIKFILKLFIINILWPVLLKIKLLWMKTQSSLDSIKTLIYIQNRSNEADICPLNVWNPRFFYLYICLQNDISRQRWNELW